MLDPSYSRTQRQTVVGMPTHYDPPYGDAYNRGFGSGPGLGQGGGYAPPPGPPPAAQSTAYVPEYDPVKLPEYSAASEMDAVQYGDKKGEDPFADFAPPQREREGGEGSRERDGAERV